MLPNLLFIGTTLLELLVIRLIKRGQGCKISKFDYLIIAMMVATSLLIMNTLIFYTQKNLWYTLSVIGILGIHPLVIFLFHRLAETFRLAEENHRLQRQMDVQDISYSHTVDSFKSIQRMVHDTNKHLLYIRACILAGDAQEAVDHISKTLHQMETSCQKVATGNLAIDAMVSHALSIACDYRIAVKHTIHVPAADICVDRYDLCIVLGNILDNALEAAREVNEIGNRFIHLDLHANNHTLVIHIRNSMAAAARRKPRNLQEPPELHGIGLSNVQRAVAKYGGHLKTAAKDGQFETVVVLPFLKPGEPTAVKSRSSV